MPLQVQNMFFWDDPLRKGDSLSHAIYRCHPLTNKMAHPFYCGMNTNGAGPVNSATIGVLMSALFLALAKVIKLYFRGQ